MKLNSSAVYPSFPFPDVSSLAPVAFKASIEPQIVFTWSRRSILIAAGMFFFTPRLALSQMFQCGKDLRIAILLSLSGPFASAGRNYLKGASEAVDKANAQGCRVQLFIEDTDTSPSRLIRAALVSEKRNASVIIAPFGPAAKLVADRVSSALIFDISQAPPVQSRPVNLVALPYALFFTTDPNRKDESLRAVGRVAVQIVLETIRNFAPGTISSPSGMIRAMADRRFSSPLGNLTLNRTIGAFELAK